MLEISSRIGAEGQKETDDDSDITSTFERRWLSREPNHCDVYKKAEAERSFRESRLNEI
jgi:hypothetical protein